ncbi:titin homolog [Haliotis cracherodii]|uniref:titin homolog n=1 Tax=Haliotis cracherodii TaxID=6455 RepID=UPI0039EBEB41
MVSLLKASFTKRKSNFTYSETDTLLEEIEKNKEVLLSPSCAAKHKRALWDDITSKINRIGEGDERTMEEVRKKWGDMQCLAKRKFARGKQELNEFEMRVIAMKSDGGGKWLQNERTFLEEPDEFEFDTLTENIQIKQEKTDEELDNPPVYFDGKSYDGTRDDPTDDYPETPIPFDMTSRKRKSNFSILERNTLLEEVRRWRKIILAKFNDTVTHEKKRLAWDEVTKRVNERGRGSYRTVEEVRKKWNDMQSLARRKKRRKMHTLLLESASNSDSMQGRDTPQAADDMEMDRLEEAHVGMEGTEDGNSYDHDIMERVLASSFNEDEQRDEIDLIEDEEEVDDDNDSNCSEWTPVSRRKQVSSKTRKVNFSTAETNSLLDEIYRRRRIIFSPNLDRRTAEKKRREWGKVAERVSEICCNKELRTLNEVRKKWSDLFTRASKFKVKIEASENDDPLAESEIDKVNRRVLYIVKQKDEEQRKADEDFEVSMFGGKEGDKAKQERMASKNHDAHPEKPDSDDDDDDYDDEKPKCDLPNSPEPDTDPEGDNLDSGIIIVQVEDGHHIGVKKVVDVINLKKEPPAAPATVDSPLVIENVASIDERVFSSMDSHDVSSPPCDDPGHRGHKDRHGTLDMGNNVDLDTNSLDYQTPETPEQFIFRRRKGKFSCQETSILLDEVKRNKSLLLSKLTAAAVNDKKRCRWKEITAKINSVRAGVHRSVDEVKKKWYDLQCTAKKKRALQESLLERLKLNQITENGDEFDTGEMGEKSQSPNFFKSHSKLLSILGTNGGQAETEKSDMATQADSDDLVGVMEPADHGLKVMNEDGSNSNDGDRPQVVSISTDKIRENIKSAPNILTRNDWRVLEITDGNTCEIANYAAIDHNYEVRLDKLSKNNEKDGVCFSENQVNEWKIESVVSQADSASANVNLQLCKKSKLPQDDSVDTASTVSHITADIAQQRLRVERKRLSVERRRLCVEQEKLRLLRRLVKLEEKRLGKRAGKKTHHKTKGRRKQKGHRIDGDHTVENASEHCGDSEEGKDRTDQDRRDWLEQDKDGMEPQDRVSDEGNDLTECRGHQKNRDQMEQDQMEQENRESEAELDGQESVEGTEQADQDSEDLDQGSGGEDGELGSVSGRIDHAEQEEQDVGEGRQEMDGEENDQEEASVSEEMDQIEQKDQSEEDSGEGSVRGSREGSFIRSVGGSVEDRSQDTGSVDEDQESGEEKDMAVDEEEMSSAAEEKEEGECDESGEDDGERLSIKYLQCD